VQIRRHLEKKNVGEKEELVWQGFIHNLVKHEEENNEDANLAVGRGGAKGLKRRQVDNREYRQDKLGV